jgi:chorismate lyase/3-hydroxybenzoate synthase
VSEQAGDQQRDTLTADLEPRFPRWVDETLGSHSSLIDQMNVRGLASGPLAILSTAIPRAADMPAATLRAEVARCYRQVYDVLASIAREPIRFWNYIPGIGDAMGDGLDRYMVFNSGRYDAFVSERRSVTGPPGRSIATASAVGIGGRDLVIHCLASQAPGAPVENPRQASSWCYSARFGPVPPWFSRGTITTLGARRVLLIGGTASVVGEQSLHHGDMTAQFEETLRNISALVARSRHQVDDRESALGRIVDLRAYVTNSEVARFVRSQLAVCCPNARRVEVARSRVCRPELLVEIEGVAEIG